jgi:hypothetical protein
MNDFHCSQMVYSRIKPQLVEENKIFGFYLRIKTLHFGRYIRCCDKMFALLQANFGDMHMQKGRDITDSNLTLADELSYSFWISDINLTKSTSLLVLTFSYFPCFSYNVAGDVNIVLIQANITSGRFNKY